MTHLMLETYRLFFFHVRGRRSKSGKMQECILGNLSIEKLSSTSGPAHSLFPSGGRGFLCGDSFSQWLAVTRANDPSIPFQTYPFVLVFICI